MRIEGLNPDCHSRIQEIQLPPRFRRQSQTVVGNSWDFGEAQISGESLWKLLSSSPECLFTTSRCGWPMASMASLGCKLRKQNLDKFVPVLARTHFSCTTDHKAQTLVQREDEDICKIEEHPQCIRPILTRSCRGLLTPRYLEGEKILTSAANFSLCFYLTRGGVSQCKLSRFMCEVLLRREDDQPGSIV